MSEFRRILGGSRHDAFGPARGMAMTAALALSVLAGCGQKGPLVMPPAAQTKVPSPAATPSSAPAPASGALPTGERADSSKSTP